MQVKDWMTPSPITVPPGTPAVEARKLMQDRHIRHLLVTEGTELVGIVTDRDLRLKLPALPGGLSIWEINYLLAKLTVGDVMTRRVITIGANRAIEAAAAVILEHRIGALPVLDEGRVVGILTQTDLLRAFVNALTVKSLRRPAPEPAASVPAVEAPCHDADSGFARS
ncbi:MAG: CBS domain-containing protein [Candidatus Rokubacteria bacterium]|nr:CBS domain-containing protein [Candidatus Rokubacteria bacterium]